MMEMFYIMIAVVFTELYIFVKTHLIVHLKSVNFIACNSYLNKTNFFKCKSKQTKQSYVVLMLCFGRQQPGG